MKPLKIFLIGVGGQGSLLATRILGEAAKRAGIDVVMSEIHGMSQRGGVVETSLVLGGLKSPLIRKGDADLLVAFEPDEALRAADYCSSKTTVMINTRPVIPSSVSTGQALYINSEDVVDHMKHVTGSVHAFDATALAEQAGTPKATNIVLIGALSGLHLFPVAEEILEKVVSEFVPHKFREKNIKAFHMGIQTFRLSKQLKES